ncbi:MAG: hypothetical protein V1835_05045 [Candidatus Micrarchaeota archaeon]
MEPISRRRIPDSNYYLAKIDRVFSRKGLELAMKQGAVIPADERLSDDIKGRIEEYGVKPSGLYFIAMRGITRRALYIPDFEHNRTIGFGHENSWERKQPAEIRGKKPIHKGAGALDALPFFFSFRPDETPERQLWGGARKISSDAAADDASRLKKEFARALKQKDPAILKAQAFGFQELNIPEPYASFKPLQLPYLRDGHIVQKPSFVSFDGRMGYRRGHLALLKIPQKEHLRNLGVPEELISQQRVLGYHAPDGADERFFNVSRAVMHIPEVYFNEKDFLTVSSGFGVMLHLLHDRLRWSGSSDESGSIFMAQNLSASIHSKEPVFFDLDTLHSDMRKKPEDLLFATESIIHFGVFHHLQKEQIGEGVKAMLAVYLEGKTAAKRRYALNVIRKLPEFSPRTWERFEWLIGTKEYFYRTLDDFAESSKKRRKKAAVA